MGRSRSRSPTRRERRRSRSRDRTRSRRHRRSRSRDRSRERERRSRSRSPVRGRDGRRRSRSPHHRHRERKRDRNEVDYHQEGDDDVQIIEPPNISEEDLIGKSTDEVDMMKVMGFCSFDTTQGKQVQGNDIYQANIMHKRKYRQYMNRRGGFNRPLEFVA